MSVIEGKFSEAVLKRIRARSRTGSNAERAEVPDAKVVSASSVSVREAQFSDFEQVRALNLKLGQGPDSIENWNRLWRDNPALKDGRGGARIGWVLEASGEVVGFFGTIPLQYEWNGQPLRAAATCRFAVEPAYRAFSHLLVLSFFRQKSVDLFLNSTATVEAGKMMAASKATLLPQPDYGTVLFWVLNPHRFTKEVFRKLGLNSGLAGSAAAVASLAVMGDSAIRGRVPKAKRSDYVVKELTLARMDEDFEELWAEVLQGPGRLSAKRTVEIMRWHFDPPHNRRKITLLACESGKKLVGYVIIRHEQETTSGLRRSLVADMIVRDDNPQVLEQLMASAFQCSKKAGSHVLEVMGFPQNIRQSFLKLKPYSRKYPACPFYYKARERSLHEKLANESAWYASPFDGDATLWP
jgi:hypothetical protein